MGKKTESPATVARGALQKLRRAARNGKAKPKANGGAWPDLGDVAHDLGEVADCSRVIDNLLEAVLLLSSSARAEINRSRHKIIEAVDQSHGPKD